MRMNEGYATTSDGVRLYYRTLGEGAKTLVMPNAFHLLDDFTVLGARRRLVVFDSSNRGRSDTVPRDQAARGIDQEVDDLEAVRRHLELEAIDLLGHSYSAFTVVLHGLRHGSHVGRAVLVGPMEPRPGTTYPAHLTGADATLREVLAEVGALQNERSSLDPRLYCEKAWSVLRRLYVVDPDNAHRINWGRCDLPNERGFLSHWMESLLPSICRLDLDAVALASLKLPVLVVHGTRDRSAPYGGGREWALRLPQARLLTIRDAGHAPWIEAPQTTLAGIEAFLDGQWPADAEIVRSVEP